VAIRIVTVDAFTNVPFAGNPAAVRVLPERRPDEWLRLVAGEMNLSDTAFLVRRDGEFDLRWLTPTVEVESCGRATMRARRCAERMAICPPAPRHASTTT
jgi:PhzF family phenazine biosynthesis protein